MQKNVDYRYLNFTSLTKTVFWDFYTLVNQESFSSRHALVKLSEVISQRKKFISIIDDVLYKRCRVQILGKGIVLRDELRGKDIKTKRQQLCKADDFLVAEIDAKVGGFGILPPLLENAIVSSHYFLFEINKSKLIPEFLGLIVKQNDFLKQVKATGSTNYSAVRPKQILGYQIPLPQVFEQKIIVNDYFKKFNEAEILEKKASDLKDEIESYFFNQLGFDQKVKIKELGGLKLVEYKNLDRWDARKSSELKSSHPIEKIGKFITQIATGTTPPTSIPKYFDGDINFYTPADLGKEMYLNNSERKVSTIAIKDKKSRKFEKGTILFVGIGSTVGKVGIVANDQASSNQQITGFKVDENVLLTEFVYYYFHYFKDVTTKEQTKVTLPIVNQNKILNIPIPVPPLKLQYEIISSISAMEQQSKDSIAMAMQLKDQAEMEFKKAIFST